MKKYTVYIGLIIFLVIVGLGCKAKKGLIKKDRKAVASENFIKDLVKEELDYQSIEIKYTTRAELDGKKYSLNVTFRNIRNETIWVSVRAMFGIEAARVIANPDSIWVISKISQLKEKGGWKEMSKMIGYPLDFMAFQNIMTRKLFYPGHYDNSALNDYIKKDEGSSLLLVPDYSDGDQRTDSEEFGFLPQFIINKKDKILSRTRLTPEDNEWMFEADYQDDTQENMGLGKNLLIKAIDSQSEIELNLKILQVKINEELKFPFQWF